MPYIYAQAMKAIKGGLPLSLRAMALEFPTDPTSWFLDRQFMFGEKILVAPVMEKFGEVEFYLPAGQWTSWWDATKTVSGPGWRKEKHGYLTLPIYVREGSILVLGHEEGEDGFKGGTGMRKEVLVYGGVEGEREAMVVDGEGRELGVLRIRGKGDLEGIEVLGEGVRVKYLPES